MDIRSTSSSPDPLGYPGDPEYLLSSATKPFSRRQSVLSPPKSQTPASYKTIKASDKSAQSVRLQDIILPLTPKGNRHGSRWSSPTKTTLHSENNISPWRIRVTVEAEREDGDDHREGDVRLGMGMGAGTRTIKVPLKGGTDSAEPTPKRRRRGESRKLEVSERIPTPRRPGGRAISQNGSDKRRGRPRKSLQPMVETSVDKLTFASTIQKPKQDEDPFFDTVNGDASNNITVEDTSPDIFSRDISSHPLDLMNDNGQSVSPALGDRVPSSGGLSKKIVTEVLHHPQELTPVRDPPTIPYRRGVSPENTIDAGHTPGPRFRVYPTPTSSSLLEEDGVEKPSHPASGGVRRQSEQSVTGLADPTNEHREFDSIMESEGFSMVSLDTLPSARQQLSSSTKDCVNMIPAKRTKNLPETVVSPSLMSKTPGSRLPTVSSTEGSSKGVRSQLLPSSSQSLQHRDGRSQPLHTPSAKPSSPKQPLPPAQGAHSSRLHNKGTVARLVRVVRAGIALQGVLDHRRNGSRLQSPFSSPGNSHVDESAAAKQRLDELFGGFDLETQRELRAGLRFGEELAKRRRQARQNKWKEWENNTPKNLKGRDIDGRLDVTNPKLSFSADKKGFASAPSQSQDEENLNITPPTVPGEKQAPTLEERIELEMARRQAEWQLEREAVSQQIQMANSSQVIVIDSEEDTPQVPSNSHEGAMEEDGDNAIDEGDYTDVWQQEARNADPHSDSSSFIEVSQDDVHKRHRREILSPWKPGDDIDQSQDEEMLSNTYWAARRNGLPFFSAGKTKMARFRDQDAHFSSLLGTPESATRRFYQDAVTPNSPRNKFRDPPGDSPSKKTLSHGVALASRRQMGKTTQSNDLNLLDRFTGSSFAGSSEGGAQYRASNEDNTSTQLKRVTEKPAGRGKQQPSGKENISADDISSPWETESEVASKQQTSVVIAERSNIEHHPSPRVSLFNKLADSLQTVLSNPHSRSLTSRELHKENSNHVQKLDQVSSPAQVPSRSRHSIQPAESESRTRSKGGSSFGKPLAVSGYFTDDHYVALRRLYRKAKNHPELFPYNQTSTRTAVLGKWMKSPDGVHCRRITEIQIAIVDRFIQDLLKGNRLEGTTGNIEWSEEELLRRLFSIIVGEQVRKEMKMHSGNAAGKNAA